MARETIGGGDLLTTLRSKANDNFTELYAADATLTTNVATNATDIASLTAAGTYAANQTLTAAECAGDTIFVTGASTMTLPAVAVGMRVTIITIGAIAVRVDVDASEVITLNGTDLTGGVDIVNASTTGDQVTLQYYKAGYWYATTATFVEGT